MDPTREFDKTRIKRHINVIFFFLKKKKIKQNIMAKNILNLKFEKKEKKLTNIAYVDAEKIIQIDFSSWTTQ